MNNFARAHDQYLEPPEDDPTCDDCGEVLVPDVTGNLFCNNKYCPSRFEGVAREIAEMLIEAQEKIKTLEFKAGRQ